MGLCSSCCSSSEVKSLKPLQSGSVLFAAQQMKVTKTGHGITFVTRRQPMTVKDAERIAKDPKTSEDFQTIFNAPFNVCNKLTKYVYLSGIASLTKENIEGLGINLIINATYEWPNIEPPGVVCIRVPVDDCDRDDISIYFDEVSDKIEENAQNGGKTLVHCMAGASRSTTLVLAYLMKYERISLKNAFHSVKKRRETGRPNVGFWEQLLKYEIRIRGQASVKMVKQTVDGIQIIIPDFYQKEFPDLYRQDIDKQVNEKKNKQKDPSLKSKSQRQYNIMTNTYE